MLRSSMCHRLQCLAVSILCLALGACSSLRGLDEDPVLLSGPEKARVQKKVDEAVEKERWAAAWNQAVDAGSGRDRLETLALGALADDDSDAVDMFEALLTKWKGLTPAARQQVDDLVQAELKERWPDWERAVEIELITAEDAPTYSAAWALYDDVPPNKAESVLEAITEARREREAAD